MNIGDKIVCIKKSNAEEEGAANKYYSVYPSWTTVDSVYVIRGLKEQVIQTCPPMEYY
jgi:hypothetical protein